MYFSSLILLFLFQFEVNHLVYFLGAVSQKTLEITDKAVDIPFTGCLQNDVLVIVIPAKQI